jgi:hypothetical protein
MRTGTEQLKNEVQYRESYLLCPSLARNLIRSGV